MTVTLLVFTDGRRDCLERTLASFDESIDPRQIHRRVIVNDCPDPDFRRWVQALDFDVHVPPLTHKRGFAGAIVAGWNAVGDTDHVFHLEDDFVFTRHVDIKAITAILNQNPHLAQMALRRQAWNDAEKAAGGIIELHPTDYSDRSNGAHTWLEHRLFFTTNPSVYPSSLTERSWPSVQYSEGVFSRELFKDPNVASGYWGSRKDEPWVIHIGHNRIGTGY